MTDWTRRATSHLFPFIYPLVDDRFPCPEPEPFRVEYRYQPPPIPPTDFGYLLAPILDAPPSPRFLYATPWAWEEIRAQLDVDHDGRARRRLALTIDEEIVGHVPLPGAMEVILTASMKLPRCGWAMLHERDGEMDAERVDLDGPVMFEREI